MMRSWGNRPDTLVCDEPLYAHYLVKTEVPHPGAQEVIRSQETIGGGVQGAGHCPAEQTVLGTYRKRRHGGLPFLKDVSREAVAQSKHVFSPGCSGCGN